MVNFHCYCLLSDRKTTHLLRVFERLVFGCFFGAKLKASAGCVCNRRQNSTSVCKRLDENLPVPEKVSFKTPFQQGNRVQIPKFVRWRFKMETDQILKVTVSAHNVWAIDSIEEYTKELTYPK
jgi:hypothetical protein